VITNDNSSSGVEIEIEGRTTFDNLTNSTLNLKSTEVWCRFAEDDYSQSGFQVRFVVVVAAAAVVVVVVAISSVVVAIFASTFVFDITALIVTLYEMNSSFQATKRSGCRH
jgi:hypothetical protein